MSEKTEVEKPCVKLAEVYGCVHYKLDRPGGKKGWPDRAFWGPNGQHFMVEFKQPGQKLSKLQRCPWSDYFRCRGHSYYVVMHVEDFRHTTSYTTKS